MDDGGAPGTPGGLPASRFSGIGYDVGDDGVLMVQVTLME